MTLKKINPEELQQGKKYFVEMALTHTDETEIPFRFAIANYRIWLHKDTPIYTHEPSIEPTPKQTDNEELKMLVDVASRIYAIPTYRGTVDQAAHTALDLITACKNELRKQP